MKSSQRIAGLVAIALLLVLSVVSILSMGIAFAKHPVCCLILWAGLSLAIVIAKGRLSKRDSILLMELPLLLVGASTLPSTYIRDLFGLTRSVDENLVTSWVESQFRLIFASEQPA